MQPERLNTLNASNKVADYLFNWCVCYVRSTGVCTSTCTLPFLITIVNLTVHNFQLCRGPLTGDGDNALML